MRTQATGAVKLLTIAGRKYRASALVQATMMAVAVGDTLGLPVEGMTAGQIAQKYGRVNRPLPIQGVQYYHGNYPAGTTSDETDLSLAMLEALGDHGLDMNKIAEAHCAAYARVKREKGGDPHPLGWGGSVGTAVLRLTQGVPWAEAGKSDDPGLGYGNGVITKLAPLALHLFLTAPDMALSQDQITFIRDLALMTHYTRMALAASFAYTAALRYCFSNTPDSFSQADFIEAVMEGSWSGETAADGVAGLRERSEPDKLITRLAMLREYWKFQPTHIIGAFCSAGRPSYVFNSLPLTLMFFLRNPFSVKTLYDVVNAGEDADSNGSLVAALLASLHKDPAMFRRHFGAIIARERITAVIDRYCAHISLPTPDIS